MTSRKPKPTKPSPPSLIDVINRSTGVYRASEPPSSDGWQTNPPYIGQDVASLIRAFGRPSAVDITETVKRKREVFKYIPIGGNRYRLRVTVENDIVVAWEGK